MSNEERVWPPGMKSDAMMSDALCWHSLSVLMITASHESKIVHPFFESEH
jgi:hypothetical protein